MALGEYVSVSTQRLKALRAAANFANPKRFR